VKDLTYSLTTENVLSLLAESLKVEDGHWTLSLVFETIPCTIPQLIPHQIVGTFPGIVSRVVEIKLIQTPQPSDTSITIINGKRYQGEHLNGIDRDTSGSEQIN
jgi:hypothetical protein